MNRRDKIIVISIGAFFGVLIAYLAANTLVFKPLEEALKLRTGLDEKIRVQRQLIDRLPALRMRLGKFCGQTLGTNETQVTEDVRARLAGLLASAGLASDKWKLTPLPASPLAGSKAKEKDKHVGWAINAHGGLEQVANFLYLLQREPYLHRLDNLKLTPGKGEITLDVTFQTLVFANRKDQPLNATMPATEPATIDDAGNLYALVAKRDIFRPFIQRKAPPPPPPAPANPPAPPAAPEPQPPFNPPAPSLDGAKLVSLSSWPEPEIVISDNGRIEAFKIGDRLGEGQVVMVDYRPLADPQDPELLTESRVILQIGQEYWAVDRGRTLGQKHRLSGDQLPPELAPPSTQPQVAQEQHDENSAEMQ